MIPEEIRKKLGLKPGDRFLVVGGKGVLVLQRLSALRLEEFDGIIKEARHRARESGVKRSDVAREVGNVRGRSPG